MRANVFFKEKEGKAETGRVKAIQKVIEGKRNERDINAEQRHKTMKKTKKQIKRIRNKKGERKKRE